MTSLSNTQTIGLLCLLSDSVLALSQDMPAGWSKLRLRNWGGVGEHYPLLSLDEVFQAPRGSADAKQYRHVKPAELAQFAQALQHTAQDLRDDPSASAPLRLATYLAQFGLASQDREYTFALSDRETEYNGVFVHVFLSDLLSASLAHERGLGVVVGTEPAVLEFAYQKRHVDGSFLAHLANSRPQSSRTPRPSSP